MEFQIIIIFFIKKSYTQKSIKNKQETLTELV